MAQKMTLNQFILEVWEMLGKPTDVAPVTRLDDLSTVDPTLPGYLQLKRWVNQAYEVVATWRTPGGQYLRQRDMIDRKYLKWGPHQIEGTFTDTTDTSELGYNDQLYDFNFPDDYFYNNQTPPAMIIIGISGLGQPLPYEDITPETLELQNLDPTQEYWRIYQSLDEDWVSLAYFVDEHTVRTVLPLPWVIPESTVTFYERGVNWRRFDVMSTMDDLYAIRQVRVMDSKSDMEIASRTENFTNNLLTVGEPTQYFREGRYLYFDKHVDKDYTLQMEYYKQVEPLEEEDDVPELQNRFYTPMILWATYRGLLRYGENKTAYSLKGFFKDEMTSIIKEDDLDVERYESHFIGGGSY